MKNYKIVLRSSGPVTQLPDSQKIFGDCIQVDGGRAAIIIPL